MKRQKIVSSLRKLQKRIIELCNKEDEIKKVIDYFKSMREIEVYKNSDEGVKGNNQIEMPGSEYLPNELLSFCIDRVDCDLNCDSNDEIKKKLIEDIKDECREMKALFSKGAKYLEDKNFRDVLVSLRDKIMYCKHDWFQLQSSENIDYKNGVSYMDAVEDCAKFIAGPENKDSKYNVFSKKFNKHVKIPMIVEKVRADLNTFYEGRFMANDFNSIFPESGHRSVLEKSNLKFENLNEEENNLLMESIDKVVKTLPFFDMCSIFGEYLYSLSITKDGYRRIKYDFNPFTSALGMLSQDKRFKVSENFNNKYFAHYISGIGYDYLFGKFYELTQAENGVVSASNWYKLAYHYTTFQGAPYSLFQDFIRSGSGFRAWKGWAGASNMFHNFDNKHRVGANDCWTKGIYKEIYGYTYGNN